MTIKTVKLWHSLFPERPAAQSTSVYINIHSAAMACMREEERVALLFARVNTFIQRKRGSLFMNA